MTISILGERLVTYYKKRGLFETIARIFLLAKRLVTEKTWLIYVDLPKLEESEIQLPKKSVKLERKQSENEINPDDMERLVKSRGSKAIRKEMKRFHMGARLWLFKLNGQFVGFIWSIKGRYVSPYYVPFTNNDATCFDAEIFPEFRGRRLAPLCENYVLLELKREDVTRVYGSIKTWNIRMLRSRERTPYLTFGLARKLHIFGRDITIWYDTSKPGIPPHKLVTSRNDGIS